MVSAWDWRPLVVVAAVDLILVAVVGLPWVAEWAFTSGSQAVASLLILGWGAGDSLEPVSWEFWRAAAICRIVTFLLLHLWVVRLLTRAAGTRLAWRGARMGAWVFGPVVGALAGLATVIPGAFDLSITVEERAALRDVAVMSLGDGAYLGLAAGAVCWIALAVSSVFARRRCDAPVIDVDEREEAQVRFVMAPRLLVAASGLIAAGTAAAVLGGPTVVRATGALAGFVSYFHWWIPDTGSPFTYVPAAALVAYLITFVPPLLTNPITLTTAPGLGAFVKGWNATTWSAIVGAQYMALLITALSAFSGQFYRLSGGSLYRAVIWEMFDELPNAAAYTALLGWIPALAVLATVRLLLRALDSGPRQSPISAGQE